MNDALEQLLKDLNNGQLHGAISNLGKILGVSHVAISNWVSGKAKPSEDNIKKIAQLLKRSEKEIQKIFDFSNSKNIIGNNNTMIINENEMLKEKNKLLQEKIKFLEDQISFYKKKSKK